MDISKRIIWYRKYRLYSNNGYQFSLLDPINWGVWKTSYHRKRYIFHSIAMATQKIEIDRLRKFEIKLPMQITNKPWSNIYSSFIFVKILIIKFNTLKCDRCEEWYHMLCVGVRKGEYDNREYICGRCRWD